MQIERRLNVPSFSMEIIIGCYKQEVWLPRALRSVLNQVNYKILTAADEPPAPFLDYTIRVWHDNCSSHGTGASAARNRALSESKADWIIWLDADDMMPSHYLHAMYFKIMFGNLKTIYSAPVQFIEGARLEMLHSCVIPELDTLYKRHRYPMGMSAAFPRDAWKDVGGFDESLRNMNDIDFWVRCGNAGYTFESAATFLFRRDVPSSLTNTAIDALTLSKFNAKHKCQLSNRFLPYRVPMENEFGEIKCV